MRPRRQVKRGVPEVRPNLLAGVHQGEGHRLAIGHNRNHRGAIHAAISGTPCYAAVKCLSRNMCQNQLATEQQELEDAQNHAVNMVALVSGGTMKLRWP